MDWAAIYGEVKGWQQAIGAIVGFSGLIAAALFNADLNRRRDDRIRHLEAVAVAAALYGEMEMLRARVARTANRLAHRYFDHGLGRHKGEEFDRHLLAEVALPDLSLYPALASQVGLLPSDITLDVVRFYSCIEQVRSRMPWLRDDPERKFSYSLDWILQPAIDAIKGSEKALRNIENFAGIGRSTETLDIAEAESALDHLDMQHQS